MKLLMMKNINKFLVGILTTILFVNLVSAVAPSSIKVKISIQNNTIKIESDNILDFSDTFSVSYSAICENSTLSNVTSGINYIRDTELVLVNRDLNDSLSCVNELAKANDKWTQCYSDNMNISIANALCQIDRGYKDNYTACQIDLVNKNALMTTKDSTISSKQTEIDNEKSGTTQKYGLGVLVGIVACYLFLRYKGQTAPIRHGEGYPQNPSNLA